MQKTKEQVTAETLAMIEPLIPAGYRLSMMKLPAVEHAIAKEDGVKFYRGATK